MDLSRFPGAENLVAVRVRERSVGGGARGVVVGCVLELEKKDGSSELREYTFSESEAFNLASFEAFIRALNQYLAMRRDQP
jgi:hypothetical protein